MFPSSKFVWFCVVPAFLALLVLVRPELRGAMLAMDAGLFLLAGLDAWISRPPLLSVHRRVTEVLSLGRPNRIELVVRSLARRRLHVVIRDDLFEGASSTDGTLRLSLPPRGTAEVCYHVLPATRGAYDLGDHFVRYGSVLGLWIRQFRISACQSVRVYPDLLQLRTFELMARQNREMAFVRATRLKGGETEFARLRDYARDDEFRSIDWRASARRQKLIAREYQLQSDQNVIFMLDAGRLMAGRIGGITRFDLGLNSSVMLAHVAAKGGDRVGMLSFDSEIRSYVPPVSGAGATAKLVRANYDVHPRIVEPDFEHAFTQIALRQRQRSLLILLTDIVDDTAAQSLVRQIRRVLRKHLPLVVLFRDGSIESLASPKYDDDEALFQAGTAAEILNWRRRLVQELSRAGSLVLDVHPEQLTGSLINRYLNIKARNLL